MTVDLLRHYDGDHISFLLIKENTYNDAAMNYATMTILLFYNDYDNTCHI